MKKRIITAFAITAMATAAGLTACKQPPASPAVTVASTGTTAVTSANAAASGASAPVTGTITVFTREAGSGTRGAFAELFGLKDGETDKIKKDAETYNSTSDIINKVSTTENAIGYISLGSVAGNPVKAVKIDGAEPSVANVENGTYTVKRPFNLIVPPEHGSAVSLSILGKDFTDFIMSNQGQKIVADAGYIPLKIDGNVDYSQPGGKHEGTLTVAGSSSVTPLMEKLAEAYIKLNPDADIQVQQSDSTTGITSVENRTADIGMSSRELKAEELNSGKVREVQIATDGIAVIVNPKNPVENFTKEQVKSIFDGTDTQWSAIN